MGYAPRPILSTYPLEGLVLRSDICGDNSTGNSFPLGFGLTEGKVACHEIGHYMNLYHVFQDGCSGLNAAGSSSDACDLNGDFICDIEPCTTTNVPCGTRVQYLYCELCNRHYHANDMTESYMSYSDDNCMNTFTFNQCQRMWATLGYSSKQIYGALRILLLTGVQGNSGCVPSFLVSSINLPSGTFCAGTSIAFSNPVNGNTATSWSWQFPGGVPATAIYCFVSKCNVTHTQGYSQSIFITVSDGATSILDSTDVAVVNCTS